METNNSRLFYVGIAYGAYPEPGARLTKTGLPVKRLERGFPYFLGTEHRGGGRAAGKLQVYHTLLPEYCGKTFFTGKPRRWKKETAGRLLEEVKERAMSRWDCREQLWAPELGEKADGTPPELLAACLYRCRPFDKIYISLEEEEGEYGLRQAIHLLLPYLSRLRQVIYVGEEGQVSLMLESWLYGEFGTVMMRAEAASPDLPWLDLRAASCEGESLLPAGKADSPGDSPVQAASCLDDAQGPAGAPAHDNGLRHINRWKALKFLDTAIKNGYNTEVN